MAVLVNVRMVLVKEVLVNVREVLVRMVLVREANLHKTYYIIVKQLINTYFTK
jgi:hypothetical protein